MIKEAYCSFEVVKLLKEKGFPYSDFIFMYVNKDNRFLTENEACLLLDKEDYIYHFDDDFIQTWTHQMAMAWLREVHKVVISIDAHTANHWDGYIDTFEIDILKNASRIIVPNEVAIHNTYEEAVEAALKYSLENLI